MSTVDIQVNSGKNPRGAPGKPVSANVPIIFSKHDGPNHPCLLGPIHFQPGLSWPPFFHKATVFLLNVKIAGFNNNNIHLGLHKIKDNQISE